MEGHQLDSESDIRNKQKKKHIRKRSCNRVLTDTITNELKRLSDLNNGSISQYNIKHENYSKTIRDVCINNFKNCLAVHQNVIPREIIVYVPKARNEVPNEYFCEAFLNNQKKIFHVNASSADNNRALMLSKEISQLNGTVRYRDDEWCCCSGFDITRLFIFAKIMYETSQQLRRLANKSRAQDSHQYNMFTISIELANLRKLLNPMPGYDGVIRLNQIHPRQRLGYKNIYKPFTKFDKSADKSIKFGISIGKHCMRFNISTCKINIFSRDFLQALETFFSVSKTATSYEANCNVPSLSVRNWHFHNIIQGYFLRILLKNINVNTLNMMRKLYFVIITCSASNLMIEIIIKLKSGIFMVYDNSFYQEVTNWNKNHQLFINKSVSMATLENALRKRYIHMHNRERQLNVITHTKTKLQQSNPNILRPKEFLGKPEKEADNFVDDYYSDSESLHTKASEISAIILPQRNGATLILQPDEKGGEGNRTQPQKTGGDTIINGVFVDNSNMYNANFLHSKQWLTKLFSYSKHATPEEDTPKENANIADIFRLNSLKESIFDRAAIQRHLESVTDLYWKQVTSQSFYMVFLKSLGTSVAKIFLNVVL